MMNDECRRMLFTVAIASFAVPTGLINGVIAFFTVKAPVGMAAMLTEMLVGCFLCGLIIPLFGPLVLKSHLQKRPNLTIGQRREAHAISRLIPLNLFLGALVIAVVVAAFFALLPFGLGLLLDLGLVMQPMTWIIFKTIYSGLVAAVAGYYGALNTLYAYANQGRVSVGA